MRAHDGADAGPYSGPLALTTQVPQPEITGHLAGSPGGDTGPGLDPQIGNYSMVATDGSVPTAGPDLTITRTYNSLDPRQDTAFGTGWASRIDMRLARDADGSGNVVVTFPTGRQVRFGRNADGSYAPPAGQSLTLVYDSSTGRWTLRDATGSRWVFDAVGRLVTVLDPYGLRETLRYDTNDHVYEIRNDTSTRALALTWTGSHVTAVRASGGPTWTYSYQGDRLAAVCAPGPAPSCTTYGYSTGSHYRSSVRDDNPRAYWRLGETGGPTRPAPRSAPLARTPATAPESCSARREPWAAPLRPPEPSTAPAAGSTCRPSWPTRRCRWRWSCGSTPPAGVLFGYQNGAGFPGAAATRWTPVLYVGTDGFLYAGFAVPHPDGPRQARSLVEVNDGRWHHVVLSAAIDTQTLYVDGADQGSTGTVHGVIDHDERAYLTLGAGRGQDWPATNGGDFYFAGSIDEVALYQHSLGALAVADHFRAAQAVDELTDVTLPQDARRYAHLRYDDRTDRVRTLDDHDGRTWTLDTPAPAGATRSATLHGPYPDWTYTFDADHGGRILSRAHDGAVRRFAYHTAGFVSAITDENGHTTGLTTNDRGDVLSRTTCRAPADCDTSYYTYFVNPADPLDPRNDRLATSADARSSGPDDTTYRTSYDYDPAGRLRQATYPIPNGETARPTATWTYATGTEPAAGGGTVPAGQLLRATGRRGQVTGYAYRATGDLAETVSPTGLHTSFGYDTLGRTTTVTTANDGGAVLASTAFAYTPLSQVDTVTGPAVTNPVTGARHQQATSYRYDGNGNTTAVTVADTTPAASGGDPPRATAYAYDAHDRLIRTTYPDGTAQATGYADDGLEITTTDAGGTAWIDRYDDQRRLLVRTAQGPGVDPQDPNATSLVLDNRDYDPAGRLATVTDAMGRRTSYTYYDDDLPAAVTREEYHDPGGSIRGVPLQQRSYDPAGNLTRLVGAGGRSTTYTYDPAGNLASQTLDPAGLARTTRYTNDADGNPTQITRTGAADPQRTELVTQTFGPDNQVTRADAQLQPGIFLSTTYGYDERGLPTTITDPRRSATTYSYDPTGALVSTTGPAVDTWVAGQRQQGVTPTSTAGRNTFGEPTERRDPNGAVTTTTYDVMGRPTATTLPTYVPPGGQPLAATTVTGYDPLGRPTTSTDPLGRTTSTAYDPHGRPVSRTLPQVGDTPATTTYGYDRDGELLATTDPTGARTSATYDDLGRQVTATDAERVPGPLAYYTTTTGYDDAGNPVRTTTPQGHTTTATFNAAGEMTTQTDPTDRAWSYDYDITGRPASVTDPAGLVTQTGYDLLGRPTTLTQRTGATVLRTATAAYDATGNTTERTSAEGRRTSYGYDAAGRLVTQAEQTDSQHTITIGFGYDAAGHRTRLVDGNGQATDYTYTPWGLPESTTEPATATAPNAADRTWTTSYDAAGQSITTREPGGVLQTLSYDAQGRLVAEQGAGAEAATTGRTLGYDAAGRVTRAGTPRGDATFRYDDRGNLVQTRGPEGSATFAYTGDGNLATRTDPAGTASFGYDPAGRLATTTDPLTQRTMDYRYDPAGRLATVADRRVASTVQRAITRDALGRVTADNVQETYDTGVPPHIVLGTSYGYDRDDNITAKTTTQPTGTAANTYGYDGASRLTGWTGPSGATTRYVWDDAGNRTAAGTAIATYNERNQLLSDGTYSYAYTPRGTLSSATTTATGSTRTLTFDAFDRLATDGATGYHYDSLDRVSDRNGVPFQYDDTTNAAASDGTRVITHEPDGTAFADRATTATTGRMLYTDAHGDVTGRYLSADVYAARTYDPFGKPTSAFGDQPTLGFQSSWTDQSTGAVNMAARWYTPPTGTFTSRDSWTLDPTSSASANRFTYANANPLSTFDLNGHGPCLDGATKGAFVGGSIGLVVGIVLALVEIIVGAPVEPVALIAALGTIANARTTGSATANGGPG